MYDYEPAEDAFLDQMMEDRISGTEHYQDPFDIDPYWEYEDEDPLAGDYDHDAGVFVREDFGYFGDEALCGE